MFEMAGLPSLIFPKGEMIMEIERINENTVKFFVTYVDIEERGFDRNEIWFSRERSEELFWEMMDEIHQDEEFVAEIDNILSIILEYANESNVTVHRLMEYGKELISENALEQVKQYFPLR